MALSDGRDHGLGEGSERSWRIQRSLVEELGRRWDEPDNGLWEIRGPLRHFTHSRVMVWAAFDRAIRGVERHGLPGPVDKWRDLRDQVRDEILAKGFNTGAQHVHPALRDRPGGRVAAAHPDLRVPPAGRPQGPRHHRCHRAGPHARGLLLRYRTDTGVDGLPGSEHPFLACSFWLVQALALAGRHDQAKELMDRLVGLVNDVGLLSEEYDPVDHRMVGNYPQAFSHLTLIGAAHALAGVTTVKA